MPMTNSLLTTNLFILSRPARPELLAPVPFAFFQQIPAHWALAGQNLLLALGLAGLMGWWALNLLNDLTLLPLALLLLALGLALWGLAKTRETQRWRRGELVPQFDPLNPLAAGCGQLAALLFGLDLLNLARQSAHPPVLLPLASLLALALGAYGLMGLGESWRLWRQMAQWREPGARALPPRRAASHSLTIGESSSGRWLLWLLALTLLILALASNARDGRELNGPQRLAIAAPLLASLDAAPRRRWRYSLADDSFICYRRQRWRWQELQRLPAAAFCGLLLDKDGRQRPLLWLAGRAGGKDVLMFALYSFPSDKFRRARRWAEQFSRASGLPLLYRWPEPPRRPRAIN